MYAGWAYTEKKMYAEAKAEYQKASALSNGHTLVTAMNGYVQAVSGEKAEALKTLKALNDLAARQYVSPFRFAIIYTGLGQKDKAFQWLNRAYDELDLLLIYVSVTPAFDPLRSDPRFDQLLQRLGLASK
jgi:tetratricopeptide (TPR) repeat protein